MHPFDLPDEFSPFDNIVVKFNGMRGSCELRAWDSSKRVKEEAVYGPDDQVKQDRSRRRDRHKGQSGELPKVERCQDIVYGHESRHAQSYSRQGPSGSNRITRRKYWILKPYLPQNWRPSRLIVVTPPLLKETLPIANRCRNHTPNTEGFHSCVTRLI